MSVEENKKTLVVGASAKPDRYSNMAISLLKEKDISTVGFAPKAFEIYGIDVLSDFEKLKSENIHTVTMYINPQRQPEYYDKILSIAPKRIIFNPGTENPEFYELARKKGVEVEEACTLVLLRTNQY